MAKIFTEEQLKKIINNYIAKLKGKISIEKAILYGSYARGTANENSDIDLLIISEALPENGLKGANGYYLDNMVQDFNLSLEVIAIHPKNLSNEITKSFYEEIFATGKVFYPKDKIKAA